MFKITRKVGETIKIGEDIRITILAVNGTKARIAIFDPKQKILTKATTEESNHQDISGSVRAPLISGDWLAGGNRDPVE